MSNVLRQITTSKYDPSLLPPFARERGYPANWLKGVADAFAGGWRGDYAEIKKRLDVSLALDAARPGLSSRVIGLYDPGFSLVSNGNTLTAFNAAGVFPAVSSASAGGVPVVAASGTTPAYWNHVSGGALWVPMNTFDITLLQAIPGIALINVYRNPTRSSARAYPSVLRKFSSGGTQLVMLGGGAYLSNTSSMWAVESSFGKGAAENPTVGYGIEASAINVPKLSVALTDVLNNKRTLIINGEVKVTDSPFTTETNRPGAVYSSDSPSFGIGDSISGTPQLHVWESWVLRLSGNTANDDADIAAISAIINARNPQII